MEPKNGSMALLQESIIIINAFVASHRIVSWRSHPVCGDSAILLEQYSYIYHSWYGQAFTVVRCRPMFVSNELVLLIIFGSHCALFE